MPCPCAFRAVIVHVSVPVPAHTPCDRPEIPTHARNVQLGSYDGISIYVNPLVLLGEPDRGPRCSITSGMRLRREEHLEKPNRVNANTTKLENC